MYVCVCVFFFKESHDIFPLSISSLVAAGYSYNLESMPDRGNPLPIGKGRIIRHASADRPTKVCQSLVRCGVYRKFREKHSTPMTALSRHLFCSSASDVEMHVTHMHT
jgi:hypothetical protein